MWDLSKKLNEAIFGFKFVHTKYVNTDLRFFSETVEITSISTKKDPNSKNFIWLLVTKVVTNLTSVHWFADHSLTAFGFCAPTGLLVRTHLFIHWVCDKSLLSPGPICRFSYQQFFFLFDENPPNWSYHIREGMAHVEKWLILIPNWIMTVQCTVCMMVQSWVPLWLVYLLEAGSTLDYCVPPSPIRCTKIAVQGVQVQLSNWKLNNWWAWAQSSWANLHF